MKNNGLPHTYSIIHFMKNMTFYPLQAFKDNYIWTLVNHEQNSVLVVDPGDAAPVIDFLEAKKLALHSVLITHHHADHCGGLSLLRAKYSPEIYAPLHPAIESASLAVDHLSEIDIEGFGTFQVLPIPGHTLEHVAYYHAEGFIFCGDTLFSAGCGRVFEGTYAQMYDSLTLLKNLPDDTKIYCGHEYTLANLLFSQTVEPENKTIKEMIKRVQKQRAENEPTLPSTLALEKKVNPFLRCEINSIVKVAEQHANTSLKTETEVFEVLRTWKNNF